MFYEINIQVMLDWNYRSYRRQVVNEGINGRRLHWKAKTFSIYIHCLVKKKYFNIAKSTMSTRATSFQCQIFEKKKRKKYIEKQT